MRNGRRSFAGGIALMIAGIIMLVGMSCISAAVNIYMKQIPDDVENVTAKVISCEVLDYKEVEDYGRKYSYMLTCEYSIVGQTYTTDYKTGYISRTVLEGDEVTFLISPGAPEKIYMMGIGNAESEAPLKFMETTVGLVRKIINTVGIIFVVAGLFTIIRGRRR